MAKIYVQKTAEKVEIVVEDSKTSMRGLKEIYDELSRELGMPKTVFMGPRTIAGFNSGTESRECSTTPDEMYYEAKVDTIPPMEAKEKKIDKRKRRK